MVIRVNTITLWPIVFFLWLFITNYIESCFRQHVRGTIPRFSPWCPSDDALRFPRFWWALSPSSSFSKTMSSSWSGTWASPTSCSKLSPSASYRTTGGSIRTCLDLSGKFRRTGRFYGGGGDNIFVKVSPCEPCHTRSVSLKSSIFDRRRKHGIDLFNSWKVWAYILPECARFFFWGGGRGGGDMVLHPHLTIYATQFSTWAVKALRTSSC